MLHLKISPGDIVAIEGKRRTVVKVWRALLEDWNQHKVRIDNFTRMNAGVSIGDTVRIITLREEVEAKRVVLAPPQDLPKNILVSNNPNVLNSLIDFPVVKNDSVPIPIGLFIQPPDRLQGGGDRAKQAVIIKEHEDRILQRRQIRNGEGSYEDIGG
jgi:transitional endoplasmic reticulum ATPase